MVKGFRSGFAGLIGRTNVGKSTFINSVLKQKVVIITDRPQTTRQRVNCIYSDADSQIIFVDCPGFFKPRDLFGKKLNRVVHDVISDADILLAMVDVAGGIGGGDFFVFDSLRYRKQPKILLLNKVDLVSREKLEGEKEKVPPDFFEKVIPVSAKTGYNIPACLEAVKERLPEGPKYFEDDAVTDQPAEMMVADIIREKLASNLLQELPHRISVMVDIANETRTGKGERLIKISAEIFTEKESQKAIVIGKSGRVLKEAGKQARKELEDLFGCKVFVELWVKVEENWTRNESMLKKFGYY
ncbi:MAG: GTPase Era [Actinomycetota bacterium]